jgi:hypothetical protein
MEVHLVRCAIFEREDSLLFPRLVFNFDQTRFLTIRYRRTFAMCVGDADVYICRVPSPGGRETSGGGT